MRALFQPVDDVVIWRNSLCKFRGILHAKVWFHSTWHNILLYNKYVYFQYNIMVHSHTLLSFQSLYQARKASDNTCVLWVSIICFGLHEFRSFLTVRYFHFMIYMYVIKSFKGRRDNDILTAAYPKDPGAPPCLIVGLIYILYIVSGILFRLTYEASNSIHCND